MRSDQLRDEYMDALIDRIMTVRYPSKEMMDRVENLAHDPDHAEVFVRHLIKMVQGTRYPSHQIMDRIERILYGTIGRPSVPGGG
jgi:hypothetical protein